MTQQKITCTPVDKIEPCADGNPPFLSPGACCASCSMFIMHFPPIMPAIVHYFQSKYTIFKIVLILVHTCITVDMVDLSNHYSEMCHRT